MTPNHSELRAKLLEMTDGLLSELLASKAMAEEATLADIEQAVRGVGQAFEQAVTAEVVAVRAAAVERTWPTCAACGQRLQAKGKRSRRLVTETGEVTLVRDYYHCPACQRGIFPPG